MIGGHKFNKIDKSLLFILFLLLKEQYEIRTKYTEVNSHVDNINIFCKKMLLEVLRVINILQELT